MKPIALRAGLLALLVLGGCTAQRPPAPAGPTLTGEPVRTVQQPLPTSPPVATQTPGAVAKTPTAAVAAMVNGQPIPMATYQAQLATAIASFSQQPGFDPKSAEGQAALAALRAQVLDWLIDQALIDQAAAREGIRVTDAQVEAEVERVRGSNPSGFAAWLEQNGFTEESFRAQTRSDLLGAAMRDRVTRDVPTRAEQVHVRHILVDTEAQARSLLDRLRKGGTTFEALARQHSKDEASRAQGGDLGFVARGILAESVEQVAFAMVPGQISDPVQSPFGWHLVQVVARAPARDIPPEMLATLRQEAFMRWLEGEREKARIERYV